MAYKSKRKYRAWRKKRYARIKERRICGRCFKSPKLEHGSSCYECYFKIASRRHLGDYNRWPELEALFREQGGRCAYTNSVLDLGRSASLEHVRPLSRDKIGASDITNFKWIDIRVNRAKNDMSLEEFVSMCKQIVKLFGFDVVRDDSR